MTGAWFGPVVDDVTGEAVVSGTEEGANTLGTLDIALLSTAVGAVMTSGRSSSMAKPGVPEPARLAAQKAAMTIAARTENDIETAINAVGARS